MIRKQLQEQLTNILKMKKKVQDSLRTAPEGRLRADMHRGKYPQYYLSDTSGSNRQGNSAGRIYLKKENMELIKKLAQKEYDADILRVLERQEKATRYYLKNYQENELIQAYQKLPEAKRSIIVPYILTDKQYIEKWKKQEPIITNTYPIENGLLTENGEQVRSKSEKMIADKLFYMGIPYKYEVPLILEKKRVIFPDFTLLNMRTRKIIYLEHFGMMDNPEYCKKAIEKIELYQANGIYLGKDLLITMESSMKGINICSFEDMIKHYF